MNKLFLVLLLVFVSSGCKNNNGEARRIPVAKAGDAILYYDEMTLSVPDGSTESDSSAIVQIYINDWLKRRLLYQKARENLSVTITSEIEKHIDQTRINLLIYEYQRQMMHEKMDTLVLDEELESYYASNESSFILNSNIVKALYIKLPVETPSLSRIRQLARSNSQRDLQELETLCYQFAETFDDFDEKWIPLNRISLLLKEDISKQENFLRRYTFYETSDSVSIYLISFSDYRLRGSLAPFEYVRDDIKRIIWNNRRIDFIRSLETGIFNDGLKENAFKIYR